MDRIGMLALDVGDPLLFETYAVSAASGTDACPDRFMPRVIIAVVGEQAAKLSELFSQRVCHEDLSRKQGRADERFASLVMVAERDRFSRTEIASTRGVAPWRAEPDSPKKRG